MIRFDKGPVPGDHLIRITAHEDGLHIVMTEHVSHIIKYSNGDVRVVSKAEKDGKPIFIHTCWNGFARIKNDITGEHEQFNTAAAWVDAAKASGITIQEEP